MIKNENLDQKVLTPQKFTVKLTNNKKIEINLDHVYGNPKAALSESEYLDKFQKCCLSSTKKIPKNKINQMIDFILDLENEKKVIDFFKLI